MDTEFRLLYPNGYKESDQAATVPRVMHTL
jgi:hypothetical protein